MFCWYDPHKQVCRRNITEKISLDRNENVTHENCKTQIRQNNIGSHMNRSSVGSLYCVKCSQLSKTSQVELSFHIAKMHGTTEPLSIHKCHCCGKNCPSFWPLRFHRYDAHGLKNWSGPKPNELEPTHGDVNDEILPEYLWACKHFLVDSYSENGRHRIDMDFLSPHLLIEKIYLVCDSLKFAAKLKVFLGLHSKIWRVAVFATLIHTKITHWCNGTNSWHERRFDINWDFAHQSGCDRILHKRANKRTMEVLQANGCDFFVGLLSRVPMGCKNTVLPETLIRECSVNWSFLGNAPIKHKILNNAASVLWLSICTVLMNWIRRRLKCLLPVYMTSKTLKQQSCQTFFWTIIRPLEIQPKSTYFVRNVGAF